MNKMATMRYKNRFNKKIYTETPNILQNDKTRQ